MNRVSHKYLKLSKASDTSQLFYTNASRFLLNRGAVNSAIVWLTNFTLIKVQGCRRNVLPYSFSMKCREYIVDKKFSDLMGLLLKNMLECGYKSKHHTQLARLDQFSFISTEAWIRLYNYHCTSSKYILHILCKTDGAQPPQVTGWELALVSAANNAESAPSKRVTICTKQKLICRVHISIDVSHHIFSHNNS